MRSTLSPLLLVVSYGLSALAWSFSVERQPETCIGINLGWSGGTPPYTFTFLHPPNVAPSNISNLTSWMTGIALSFGEEQAWPVSSGGIGFGTNYFGFTPMVIVASDATGFGSGGTSEAFIVQPETPPLLPGCSTYPNNTIEYLSYLEAFDTNPTTCGNVTARVNVTALASSMIYVDTIVPLGQSYRTVLNASASNGLLSWPLTVSAGTNVSFVFSTTEVPGFDGKQFVTPLMLVQPGNTSCQATGTLSSATALPTGPNGGWSNGSPASGGMVGSTLLVLLPAVIAAVIAAAVLGML
ncbi:hypothetical protein CALVIDRAFT_534644, partial [Calocera viscosa TUFC12733]